MVVRCRFVFECAVPDLDWFLAPAKNSIPDPRVREGQLLEGKGRTRTHNVLRHWTMDSLPHEQPFRRGLDFFRYTGLPQGCERHRAHKNMGAPAKRVQFCHIFY